MNFYKRILKEHPDFIHELDGARYALLTRGSVQMLVESSPGVWTPLIINPTKVTPQLKVTLLNAKKGRKHIIDMIFQIIAKEFTT